MLKFSSSPEFGGFFEIWLKDGNHKFWERNITDFCLYKTDMQILFSEEEEKLLFCTSTYTQGILLVF